MENASAIKKHRPNSPQYETNIKTSAATPQETKQENPELDFDNIVATFESFDGSSLQRAVTRLAFEKQKLQVYWTDIDLTPFAWESNMFIHNENGEQKTVDEIVDIMCGASTTTTVVAAISYTIPSRPICHHMIYFNSIPHDAQFIEPTSMETTKIQQHEINMTNVADIMLNRYGVDITWNLTRLSPTVSYVSLLNFSTLQDAIARIFARFKLGILTKANCRLQHFKNPNMQVLYYEFDAQELVEAIKQRDPIII